MAREEPEDTVPLLQGPGKAPADEAYDAELDASTRRGALMFAAKWAQQGVYLSYLGLYLSYLGYPLMDIGVLYTLLMVGMALGSYLLPMVADRARRHTAVALASHALGTCTLFSLAFLPSGTAYFSVTATLVTFGNFWNGGFGPLVDSAVFQICAKYSNAKNSGAPARRSADFGRMRLWGCVSWGVAVWVTSAVVSIAGVTLRSVWYAYIILAPLTSYFSYHLLSAEFPSGAKPASPPRPPSTPPSLVEDPPKKQYNATDTPATAAPQPPREDTGQPPKDRGHSAGLLSSLRVWVSLPLVPPFLLSLFILGALFATLNTYVYLWAVDTLGASYVTIGTATVLLNLCEIVVFLYSRQAAAVLGVHGVLYLSVVAYGVRLFAYAYWVRDPWWIVVFEPLHALTFSLPMGTLGTFTTKTADEVGAPRVSAQGLRTGTMNAGRAAGFLVSAYLFEYFSATFMFKWMAFIAMPIMFAGVVALEIAAVKAGLSEVLFPDSDDPTAAHKRRPWSVGWRFEKSTPSSSRASSSTDEKEEGKESMLPPRV